MCYSGDGQTRREAERSSGLRRPGAPCQVLSVHCHLPRARTAARGQLRVGCTFSPRSTSFMLYCTPPRSFCLARARAARVSNRARRGCGGASARRVVCAPQVVVHALDRAVALLDLLRGERIGRRRLAVPHASNVSRGHAGFSSGASLRVRYPAQILRPLARSSASQITLRVFTSLRPRTPLMCRRSVTTSDDHSAVGLRVGVINHVGMVWHAASVLHDSELLTWLKKQRTSRKTRPTRPSRRCPCAPRAVRLGAAAPALPGSGRSATRTGTSAGA